MDRSIRLARKVTAVRVLGTFGSIFLFCGFFASTTFAQGTPFAPVEVADANDAEQVLAGAISQGDAERLVDQLGAATFAERERAVGKILEIGMPMVPFLRDAAQSQADPERQLRARAALTQLTSGNFETQVANFLSGNDSGPPLEGWPMVEATLGDNPAIRQLFIEILRAHPELVASLEGTTRDRTVAIDQAGQLIQTNMFQKQQFPTLADGVALLLPLMDPAVSVSGNYESALINVLQKQMASLRRDASLWPPVSMLLDQWVRRSRIENRNDVLWYSMQWDLAAAGALGVRTLNETTDVETLQTAMQAIARFGTIQDAKSLAMFIENDQPAATRMPVIVDKESLRVTLGDVAVAAIAVLYKVPLQDIGMTQGELHAKVAFLVDNAGYLPNQSADRVDAQNSARSWLSGEPPKAKPRS